MMLTPPPVKAESLAEIRRSLMSWVGSFEPFRNPGTR